MGGELGGETNLKIEKTESGQTKVSRIRNEESSPEIIGPQWKPKFYSETEKNTDNNWESFMERRGTYRKEGPIFLSYTSVRGSKTFSELREELKSMVEKGFISRDGVVLILTGTHGDLEGKSALTDLKLGRVHCNKRLYLKKIF